MLNKILLVGAGLFTAWLIFRPRKKRDANGFDENGLRYDINYLNAIFPAIVYYDRDEQAKFVDVVTFTVVNNGNIADVLMLCDVPTQITPAFVKNLNATGIGNAAYIALHCKDKEHAAQMDKILNDVKQYFKTH